MRKFVLASAAAVAVGVSGAFAPGAFAPSVDLDGGSQPHARLAGGPPSDAGPGARTAICFVTKGAPDRERTRHVSRRAADALVRSTQSYRGPCAEYGESAPRGEGELTAYSQVNDEGEPIAVGMVFPSETLTGLPVDPPTDGKWCYDKDGDGHEDPMTECAGGYEDALELGEDFRENAHSPFTYVLANWNPMGHMPPGIYDLPHFDVHFYTTPNEERLAIRPGPCGALVHCDDYPKGKDLPDERYLHPDFEDGDAVEPAMGNHLIDMTAPEHHGEDFTHTFIYGVWDDDVTFYEPMVTKQWYSGLVDGTVNGGCHEIKQPAAWKESGWHPTEYCMRYRTNRDEVTTTLEAFEYRQAS